jgi:hypothetical protein
MTDIVVALNSLVPNAKFKLAGNSYSDVVWVDDRDIPSEDAVTAEIARLDQEYIDQEYARNRAEAYPSIEDQLDMQYWDAVNGTTTWADAIAQVKASHPKP